MRTVEEILAEARSKGLTLANMFQLMTISAPNERSKPTGEWQVNFRHATGWTDHGRGMSAAEALEDGLLRCKGAKGHENRPLPKPVKVVETVDMDDLI